MTRFLALSLALLMLPGAAARAELVEQIELIDNIAGTICGAFERTGYKKADAVSAELEGSITGLLADAKANASLSRDVENYANVLQENLPEELKSVRECRLKIWNDMHVIIFSDGSQQVSMSQGAILQQVRAVPSGPGAEEAPYDAAKAAQVFRSFQIAPGANPSFDCRKAGTTSEKVLCSHLGAARADQVLGRAYKDARARVGKADRTVLRDSQRSWIKFRDDVCVVDTAYEKLDDATYNAFAGCLERETENRTLQLMSYR